MLDNNTAQILADLALLAGAILLAGARRYLKKIAPQLGNMMIAQVQNKSTENGNGNGNGASQAVMLALVSSEAKRLEAAVDFDRAKTRERFIEARGALDTMSTRITFLERDFGILKTDYGILKVDYTATRDNLAAMRLTLEAVQKLLETMKPPPTPPDKAVIPLDEKPAEPSAGEGSQAA